MSDMPERLLAWPSGHNYQRVSLAGGRPNDAVEYVRANAIPAALDPDAVARMVQEAVQAEREACEVVAYNYMINQGFYDCRRQAETISAEIRARGNDG